MLTVEDFRSASIRVERGSYFVTTEEATYELRSETAPQVLLDLAHDLYHARSLTEREEILTEAGLS